MDSALIQLLSPARATCCLGTSEPWSQSDYVLAWCVTASWHVRDCKLSKSLTTITSNKMPLAIQLLERTHLESCSPAGRSLLQASSSCTLPGGGVTEFMQCGGLSNAPAGLSEAQANATWACCPAGTTCQYQSDYYWQCVPPASDPACVQVSSSASRP